MQEANITLLKPLSLMTPLQIHLGNRIGPLHPHRLANTTHMP